MITHEDMEAEAHLLTEKARRMRNEANAEKRRQPGCVSSQPELVTVGQFCQRNPWARVGGMRHALFYRAQNGLDACVVQWGRKVLLDEPKVIEWMRSGLAGKLTP